MKFGLNNIILENNNLNSELINKIKRTSIRIYYRNYNLDSIDSN